MFDRIGKLAHGIYNYVNNMTIGEVGEGGENNFEEVESGCFKRYHPTIELHQHCFFIFGTRKTKQHPSLECFSLGYLVDRIKIQNKKKT